MTLQDTLVTAQRSESNAHLQRKAPSISSISLSSGPIPPSAGIQSMLRTTTEIGNIGQLTLPTRRGQRPPHMAQLDQYRSNSFESSNAWSARHSRPPQNRFRQEKDRSYRRFSGRPIERSGSAHSSLSSYMLHPHIRHHSRHFEAHAKPQLPPHLLRTNRSVATLRSHGEARSRRSGSSSNRSTSSNILRYYALPSEDFYIGAPRLPTAEIMTSKHHSASLHTAHTSANTLRNLMNLNQSAVSLPRVSPSEMSHSGLARRVDAPVFNHKTRYINRTSSSLAKPYSGHSANHHLSIVSDSLKGPHYYDYSEPFFEEGPLPPNMHSLPSLQPYRTGHAISDVQQGDHKVQAQTCFEAKLGSPWFPAELPTDSDNQNIERLTQAGSHDAADAGLSRLKEHRNNCLVELPTEIEKHSKQRSELGALAENSNALSAASCGVNAVPSKSSLTGDDPALSPLKTPSPHHKHASVPSTATRRPIEALSPCPDHPVSSQSREQLRRILELKDSNVSKVTKPLQPLHGTERIEDTRLARKQSFESVKSCKNETQHRPAKTRSSLPDLESGELSTPLQQFHLSMATSHGKSTVASLLDKHIESLGLMAEQDTFSESSEQPSIEYMKTEVSEEPISMITRTFSWPLLNKQLRVSNLSTYRSSSLNSDTRMRLRPRKLFASTYRHMSGPFDLTSPPLPAVTSHWHDIPCEGWQTLPSTSQSASRDVSTKPTVLSGEMADIDTDVHPLGCKVWHLSQLSLPTSFESSASPHKRDLRHTRSKSDASARERARHRRCVRVRMKQRSVSASAVVSMRKDEPDSLRLSKHSHTHAQGVPCINYAELDGDQPKRGLETAKSLVSSSPSLPNRWSSILAAMPMPVTGQPIFPRKVSTCTNRSRRSRRSQHSIVEPLNSTRQLSQVPRIKNTIPRLAPPNLGPQFDKSMPDLTTPYGNALPSIQPVMQEFKSSIDRSRSQIGIKNASKSVRRQLGIRPLRMAVQESRRISTLASVGLPVRDGIPIQAVGPFGRSSMERYFMSRTTAPTNETVPMSEFAFRKKKVVEKVKDWWRRRCMQKAFTTRKKRFVQSTPGGILL